MPAFIRTALRREGLTATYKQRPPYQQNDYVGWIQNAVRKETKQQRLEQMLEELRGGTRYMKMSWRPRRVRLDR